MQDLKLADRLCYLRHDLFVAVPVVPVVLVFKRQSSSLQAAPDG